MSGTHSSLINTFCTDGPNGRHRHALGSAPARRTSGSFLLSAFTVLGEERLNSRFSRYLFLIVKLSMVKYISLPYFTSKLIHTSVMELTRFLEASKSGSRAGLMSGSSPGRT